MYTIIMSLIMTIMLSTIMMLMCIFVSKKNFLNREKMSPFECGFTPKSSPRSPFSSQFFLIAVLFLVFDVEIVIILPMISSLKSANMTKWFMTSTMMIIILLVGLYHEWENGVLEWTN
uniref:NADH-ubiquinone oxidoreductase chain 3 n=1 Tax=Nesidiocoris poppiusi TaxID=3059073 RepID=A0AAT9VVV1_9HEMI|nr:NADH dehydrogenase subunit 3 [Nesidiocoris poppiusi]WKW91653.1 NADH dehydrogenase subunit 3 [Nesidiocoris poppiusi]